MTAVVSERALLKRINRKLASEGEVLRCCREGSRWYSDFGRYYSVVLDGNTVNGRHVDIKVWGRELGALRQGERAE